MKQFAKDWFGAAFILSRLVLLVGLGIGFAIAFTWANIWILETFYQNIATSHEWPITALRALRALHVIVLGIMAVATLSALVERENRKSGEDDSNRWE
jgi:hypothetical protein